MLTTLGARSHCRERVQADYAARDNEHQAPVSLPRPSLVASRALSAVLLRPGPSNILDRFDDVIRATSTLPVAQTSPHRGVQARRSEVDHSVSHAVNQSRIFKAA